MKWRKLIFIAIAISVLSSCSKSRSTISLTDNYGIYLTGSNSEVLSIQSIETINNDHILDTPYQEIDLAIQFEIREWLTDEKKTVNQFSLDTVHLVLSKDYEKPVMVQYAIVTEGSALFSDYLWEDENEAVFNLDTHFNKNELVGVYINVLNVNDKDIVTEYESYFFIMENR